LKLVQERTREYPGSNRYRQGLPQQNSSSSATKRKDEQMGLHKIKKFLHNKIEESTYRMGEKSCSYTSDKGLINRI
jgi:hypothetical protein